MSAQDLLPQSHGISGLNVTYRPEAAQGYLRSLHYTRGKLLTSTTHILFIQRKFHITDFMAEENG